MGARAGRVGDAGRRNLGIVIAAIALSGPAAAGERLGGTVVATKDGLCLSCHGKALLGGHKTGLLPVMTRIPEGWPLDRDGRITCRTCHTGCTAHLAPGRGTQASPRGDAGSPPAPATRNALRGSRSGEAFCQECHGRRRKVRQGSVGAEGVQGPRGPAGPSSAPVPIRGPVEHQQIFAVAHPAAEGKAGAGIEGIDETSQRCLACHDGTVGGSVETGGRPAPGIGSRQASHPIGVFYPPQPPPGSEGTFLPAIALDRRVNLVEGRVGCLTCHDLFGTEEKLLVMSNRESRLCYSCHDI